MWCKRVFKRVCVFFIGWQAFAALVAPRAIWTLRELPLSAELWSNEWAWQNIFRVGRGYSERVKTILPYRTYTLGKDRQGEAEHQLTAAGCSLTWQRPGTLLKRNSSAGANVSPRRPGIQWVRMESVCVCRGMTERERQLRDLCSAQPFSPPRRYLLARRRKVYLKCSTVNRAAMGP